MAKKRDSGSIIPALLILILGVVGIVALIVFGSRSLSTINRSAKDRRDAQSLKDRDHLTIGNLTLLLVLLSALLLIISYAIQEQDAWLSDFTQNLGASFLFALIALHFVDAIVQRHARQQEEAQWARIRPHVGHYVGNVGRRCALAYRSVMGIGDHELRSHISPEDSEVDLLHNTALWIEERVVPELPRLERLGRNQWLQLFADLKVADDQAREVLLLFGERLPPAIHEQVWEIRRGITRVNQSYELWGSLLGTPGDPLFITEDMHIYPMMLEGLARGFPRHEVFRLLRENAVQDAINEAANVLISATRLLRETQALLPENGNGN